jgi:hypothetical protein
MKTQKPLHPNEISPEDFLKPANVSMSPSDFARWQHESYQKVIDDMRELRRLFVEKYDKRFLQDCGIKTEETNVNR